MSDERCSAKHVWPCVLTAGHDGPHKDWTDRKWTQADLDWIDELRSADERRGR